MSGAKNLQGLRNLKSALQRLQEALVEPETNPLAVDGTLQRFEFVIELFWKTLKRLLVDEGVQAATPKETLQQAYEAHWLADEGLWLQMLKDRNETSHVYDEVAARKIYLRVKQYLPELEKAYAFLLTRASRKD